MFGNERVIDISCHKDIGHVESHVTLSEQWSHNFMICFFCLSDHI